jgi:hypothetical protein
MTPLRAAAVHEAAHTLAALQGGAQRVYVGITFDGAGKTAHDGNFDSTEAELVYLMAGSHAQARLLGCAPRDIWDSPGCATDRRRASPLVGALAYDMDLSFDEAESYAHMLTTGFIAESWRDIVRVAAELREADELLDAADVQALLEQNA